MTKHLRLFMLMLLALVCMGGYSQETKSVVYSIAKTPSKSSGAIDVTWAIPTGGSADSQTLSRGYGWSKKTGVKLSAKITSEQDLLIDSIFINANTNSTVVKDASISVSVGNSDFGTQYVSKGSEANGNSNANYKFSNTTSSNSKDIVITLSCSKKSIWIKAVTIYYTEVSDKQESGLKFRNDKVNITVPLYELEQNNNLYAGEMSDWIDNPNNLPLTYESSDETKLKVDADGKIYIYKEGDVTVTAHFAGDATYKASDITMPLTIRDSRQDSGLKFK